MNNPNYFLTPDSVSIQPEPQDFEMVEREFGPLPLDASESEAAHRYRFAQATKILRLSGLSMWDPVKIAADRDVWPCETGTEKFRRPHTGLTTIDERQWPNGIVASNRSAPIPRDRTPTSTRITHTKASITLITILGPLRSPCC
jgi:hypothetical protein